MSRTVNVNPLLVLLSILVGTSIGDWLGGFFGSFVAALLSIPVAGALQVIAREVWQATAWQEPPDGEPRDPEQNAGEDELKVPACSVAAGQSGSATWRKDRDKAA
jgi:hypothetical protein